MTSSWSGPSGDAFALLDRRRLGGVPGAEVNVTPLGGEVPSSFLVDVDWSGGGLLCEVSDSVSGVRVLDDDGEDVSVEAALRYIAARAAGTSKSGAWRQAKF
jgi:hypothetical protein